MTTPRPCWIAWDSSFARYRVPVGTTKFVRTVGPLGVPIDTGTADVFYDAEPGDCGLNDYVTDGEAPLPDGWRPVDDLPVEFFVTDIWHLDRHSGAGGPTSKHELTVTEHDAVDCAGGPQASGTDSVTCFPDTPSRQMDWHEGLDGFGESPSPHCHRPDVLFGAAEYRKLPTDSGYQSYKVVLTVSVCDSAGANCTLESSQSGCLNMQWVE